MLRLAHIEPVGYNAAYRMEGAVMADHELRSLWDRWISLWNGDLQQADDVIHPDFSLHRLSPTIDDSAIRGRDDLVGWITQTRSFFPDLVFTVEVGPIADGDVVAGRWLAEGTYQGGLEVATVPAGTRVSFHGNDIWRAENGQVREYRLSDDILDLLAQLGAFPAR